MDELLDMYKRGEIPYEAVLEFKDGKDPQIEKGAADELQQPRD